ncbi:MAG: hypothetical protein OQJ89_02640 [Kangiellaceae bacterium]|nr:hypothetical protein [Kangiellaceae bacterium]MCW8999224.1 hypothetical protein [Kangiellaceae bacterium]MCW9015844.1 hypothetical protein [Kangiellaceae bacterium]
MKQLVKYIVRISFTVGILLIAGCSGSKPDNRAVYLLLDTSGTYTEELQKAQVIINYLLATLDSGDSIAVARIDSGSFSEKDIVAKATFDLRPSTANDQKRLFKQQIDTFVANVKYGSRNTDITGGVVQASDFVNETQAGDKYVLIFSDLEEDLQKGHVRDFPIDVQGINVVALNVTKLRSDNVDPRDYKKRLLAWQDRVEKGGGQWRVLNDLERLERLISYQ